MSLKGNIENLRAWFEYFESLTKKDSMKQAILSRAADIFEGRIIDVSPQGQWYLIEVTLPTECKGVEFFASFAQLQQTKEILLEAMNKGKYSGPRVTGPQFKKNDVVKFRPRFYTLALDVKAA